MTRSPITDAHWAALVEASTDFTCYSAGIATWLIAGEADWQRLTSTGLWLRVTDAGDGLFGFGYWPPERRSELGLRRAGSDELGEAMAGLTAELERSGRVIVAADGLNLPWHTASGKHHAPHWFLLTGEPDALEILDPFACRNEYGEQIPTRRPVSGEELVAMVPALPRDNPIYRLREILAFGDQTDEGTRHAFQWFTATEVPTGKDPGGQDGPAAVLRLAEHFRARGQDPRAYAQADDIWSIARHRAFLCRYEHARAQREGNGELEAWIAGHALPLAKRWGHIAPLLMQASFALRAGRPASASVPDTLERLAAMEAAAAEALPEISSTITRP